MKRIKTPSKVMKISGEADPLETRIKGPLCDCIIRQGIKNFFWDLFPLRQINHLDITTVYSVSKKQDLKGRGLGIFIYAAFAKIYIGISLKVNG